MIALSAFLCTTVVHLYFRADRFCKVPDLLKNVFLDRLAKIYCIIPKDVKQEPTAAKVTVAHDGENLIEKCFSTFRDNMIKSSFDILMTTQEQGIKKDCNCNMMQLLISEIAKLNNLEKDISEIRDYMNDTRKKLEIKEHKTKLAAEWKLVALVLDRTIFFIYLLITIITLAIMFSHTIKNRYY